MKRTLTFPLLLALATLAAAQTATVVQKPKTDPPVTSVSTKPSPATVKVVPVSAPKTSPVVAKPAAVPAQPSTAKPVSVSAANTNAAANPAAAQAVKSAPAKATGGAVSVQPVARKTAPADKSEKKTAAAPAVKDPFSGSKKIEAVRVKTASAAQPKPVVKSTKSSGDAAPTIARKIGAAGRRDPFISPVVSLSVVGSGCSSGKRCLAIEQIALRGVVRSDTGMIAVVVNALDKAYFLRENDPVFNGFVEKITADSIVFKQTFHDKLGKPLTRDVTKTISRPAA